MVTTDSVKQMGLNELALIIIRDWKNVSASAAPYLEAMTCLKTIKDKFYADDASSVVSYFLSNAHGYRGQYAKVIKQELKNRVKGVYNEN